LGRIERKKKSFTNEFNLIPSETRILLYWNGIKKGWSCNKLELGFVLVKPGNQRDAAPDPEGFRTVHDVQKRNIFQTGLMFKLDEISEPVPV
jgi:hypothetical protein